MIPSQILYIKYYDTRVQCNGCTYIISGLTTSKNDLQDKPVVGREKRVEESTLGPSEC